MKIQIAFASWTVRQFAYATFCPAKRLGSNPSPDDIDTHGTYDTEADTVSAAGITVPVRRETVPSALESSPDAAVDGYDRDDLGESPD